MAEINKEKGQKDIDLDIKDVGNDDAISIKSKLNNPTPSSNDASTKKINKPGPKKSTSRSQKSSSKNESSDSVESEKADSSSSKKSKESPEDEKKKAEEMFGKQDEKVQKKDAPNTKSKGESGKGVEGPQKTGNSGANNAAKQIDAGSKVPKTTGAPKMQAKMPGGSGGNALSQGLKKGVSNAGNAAKEGAKKAAQQAGKAIASAAKKLAAAAAKAIASNPYAWLVIAIVIVVLVVGILLYQLFNKDVAETDIDATVEYKEAMQNAINSGEIEGEVNQVNQAVALNDSYGSYLGYTTNQLDYLYNKATDTTGLDKESTRYALVTSYKTKYGLGETNTDGVLRVSDYKELYKHILNTEKYNFNEIEWLNYNHDQDGSRVLGTEEMIIDSSLGVRYPKDSSMTYQKFMDLASPYLLSNYVPLSFLVAESTRTQSDAFNNGLVSNQDTLKDLGIDSSSTYRNEDSLAYQILKYGLSDITISQYQLKHYTLNTYYLDYDATDYHEEFSVTERKTYTTVKNSKGEVVSSGSTSTYTYNNDLATKQGTTTHKNTRWNDSQQEDVLKETVIESYPTYENVYYVTYAKAFDMEKTANYTHTKYNDNDVNSRTNANSESIIDSEYNEIIDKDNKITQVSGIGSVSDLNKYGTYNANPSTTSPTNEVKNNDGSTTTTYTVTTKYNVTGKKYTENVGTRYDIDRQWDDEVTSANSETKALHVDKVINFNKNEENDEDKSTIDEGTFKASDDYKYYENLATNKELNVIDILDSNPKVYQNYISGGNSQSEYIGMGRTHLATKITYESTLKSYMDTLAEDNKLKLVWGSSLGYQVSSGDGSGNGSGGYGTAYSLMLQLLHEFEGGGTVYQNMEGVDCYKVLNVVGNMTVGHGIDITVNPQWKAQLEEKTGMSITFGSLVPCEFVDAIEEDFINRKLASIEATCTSSGIELKEYQKHALLIRMYNVGNIVGFPSAYKSYYNPDVDDRYESTYEKYADQPENVSAITSCADMGSALYNNFLNKPVTSNGQVLQGLVTRRKEEYYLFSLGYYTHNNLHAFYTEGLSFNGIQAVKSDGSIDVDACFQLQAALEDAVFDGNFHSPAPAINRPWGQRYSPNTKENTDDHGYLSDNYKQFFATSLYYQCPWWSRGRANIYLNSVNSNAFNGTFIRDGLGHGKNLAQGVANAYKVPFYTDLSQLTPNCIISYGAGAEYGHTAYVEAVGNDYYVISHCGSGVAWHGISIVPKTANGMGSGYGLVGFVKMDDIVAKYGK